MRLQSRGVLTSLLSLSFIALCSGQCAPGCPTSNQDGVLAVDGAVSATLSSTCYNELNYNFNSADCSITVKSPTCAWLTLTGKCSGSSTADLTGPYNEFGWQQTWGLSTSNNQVSLLLRLFNARNPYKVTKGNVLNVAGPISFSNVVIGYNPDTSGTSLANCVDSRVRLRFLGTTGGDCGSVPSNSCVRDGLLVTVKGCGMRIGAIISASGYNSWCPQAVGGMVSNGGTASFTIQRTSQSDPNAKVPDPVAFVPATDPGAAGRKLLGGGRLSGGSKSHSAQRWVFDDDDKRQVLERMRHRKFNGEREGAAKRKLSWVPGWDEGEKWVMMRSGAGVTLTASGSGCSLGFLQLSGSLFGRTVSG